jgi:hypothetical protein
MRHHLIILNSGFLGGEDLPLPTEGSRLDLEAEEEAEGQNSIKQKKLPAQLT